MCEAQIQTYLSSDKNITPIHFLSHTAGRERTI